MAYFSQSYEGSRFEDECARCKFGDKPCPIRPAWVQYEHNYDAANNDTASAILDYLVSNTGECAMLRQFPELLKGETA